ncbi:MAG: hypothetical protein NT113_06520 [Hyphomicrobiales bacterium]|nr:hypothetical protein [Hyphomicrobiales bacterium]
MIVAPFIQGDSADATLDSIEKLIAYVEPEDLIFCFAYATFSGCAEFQRRFGDAFWNARQSRWLFGVDYGRTAPAALKFISAKPNTTVKIANGDVVVTASGFAPEQDFHMKACFAWNETNQIYGMIAGSGNFSRNGLTESTECGTLLVAKDKDEYATCLKETFDGASELWDEGIELNSIFELYKETWSNTIFRAPAVELQIEEPDDATEDENQVPAEEGEHRFFWIDAGYVTRNRGADKPGNQIDLPRGTHKFFALPTDPNQQKNSVIGDITFVFSQGNLVRALRLGNNMMEKITLPIPEDYGIGAYDGTIIEFERVADGFKIRTFEPNEYLFAFGKDPDFRLYKMDSGRPYGFRGYS